MFNFDYHCFTLQSKINGVIIGKSHSFISVISTVIKLAYARVITAIFKPAYARVIIAIITLSPLGVIIFEITHLNSVIIVYYYISILRHIYSI